MWIQISGFSGLRGLNRSMIQICFCGIHASCFCEDSKSAFEGLAAFETPYFGGSFHIIRSSLEMWKPRQRWVSREPLRGLTLLSFPEWISGGITDTFCKNSAAFKLQTVSGLISGLFLGRLQSYIRVTGTKAGRVVREGWWGGETGHLNWPVWWKIEAPLLCGTMSPSNPTCKSEPALMRTQLEMFGNRDLWRCHSQQGGWILFWETLYKSATVPEATLWSKEFWTLLTSLISEHKRGVAHWRLKRHFCTLNLSKQQNWLKAP